MSKQSVSWIVFILMLVFALIFIMHTAVRLPALVPAHFDMAGYPDSFMTHAAYVRFTLLVGVGLPIAMVSLLRLVYMNSKDMKLPNRDYWLAPERISQTRAKLVSHGVWFGSLLVAMVCFVHWLQLQAHRRIPPQLPNAALEVGLLVFFLIASGWIIALLIAFRRPSGE